MDTAKANEVLVPYMINIIEKKAGKKFNYSLNMANDALKHSEYMMSQKKAVPTPENLLYCNENLANFTVPSKYLKIAILNMINKWFRYSQSKNKIMNSNEMGIGICLKEKDNMSTIFITQRMR